MAGWWNASKYPEHSEVSLTQELLAMQAALIEYNLTAVDAAINAVREALASGLDWRELGQMIKAERRAGNPVAGLIDSLALEKNKITVVLENSLDEDGQDDDAMTQPATKVSPNAHLKSTCIHSPQDDEKVPSLVTLLFY